MLTKTVHAEFAWTVLLILIVINKIFIIRKNILRLTLIDSNRYFGFLTSIIIISAEAAIITAPNTHEATSKAVESSSVISST